MKWIGQHIYDLVARFRDDIYLEGISTSTETDMLVVDSNGKVGKRAIDAITVDVSDFMSDGADNRVLTATGTDAMQAETYFTFENTSNISSLSVFSNEDTADRFVITTTTSGATTLTTIDGGAAAANFEIAADGNITLDAAGDIALECGGSDLTCDARQNTFSHSAASSPSITLENNADDATGAQLIFLKDKGAAGADGDDLGTILFKGDNTAQETISFASIVAEISEADDTDEAGKLSFLVAESDGTTTTLTRGLMLEGEHATDGQVDVTIANGAASTTTIAGTLTMGSTAALTNAGLVSVAAQTNITSVGTLTGLTTSGAIELGHASDTTIARSASGTVTIEGNEIVVGGASGSNYITIGNGTGYVANPVRNRYYMGHTSYGFQHDNWAGIYVDEHSDGTTWDSSKPAVSDTFTTVEDYVNVGMIVPVALTKIDAKISSRPGGSGSSSEVFSCFMAIADRTQASTTNMTWTIIAVNEVSQTQGKWTACDLSYTGAVSADKVVCIGMGIDDADSDDTTQLKMLYNIMGTI